MTSKMRATMADVAELAQVSIKSISRVLNGQSGVSEETRQRILNAMQQLGYVANPAARRLRGTSNVISLVVPGLLMSDYVGHVTQGMVEATQRLGYNLVLHIQHVSPRSNDYYRSLIASGLTDGLLMVVPHDYDVLSNLCYEYEMPFVMVDDQGDADMSQTPVISATNRQGVMDATRYLMALGHKRIAFITGMMHMRSARERLRGYQDALNQIGLTYDPALVVQGDWSQQTGFTLTQQLLQMAMPPTAIVASNDVTAFGVMDAVKDAGARVGEDVSVVGFDDIGMAVDVYPALTTIRQPMQEMGQAAVEMLVALIDDRSILPLQRQFSTELIVRQSTGPVKPIHST